MADIERFRKVQKKTFEKALKEIESGEKKTHWMWYIFPQIKGLGESPNADYYGIESEREARLFLQDEYLGGNLRKICKALLALKTNDALEIFGRIDEMKLRSSMTLFYIAEGRYPTSVFVKVLDKFFDGEIDDLTVRILERRN